MTTIQDYRNMGITVVGIVGEGGGNGVPATTPTATNEVLGKVGAPGDVIQFTPTLDTSAYQDGDTLFDFTELASFVREKGGRAVIQSLTVVDKDDQKIAFDLFTNPTSVTLGTANAAPSISDANAATVQNIRAPGKTYTIETGDYKDLGGVSIATVSGIGLVVEADSASTSIYIGGVIRGAPTYTASGLVFRFGLLWF